MKTLALFGGSGAAPHLPAITVDGITLPCAVVAGRPPPFDDEPGAVLLRVLAVSCNFRDRSLFRTMGSVPAHRFTAIGSELVGEVLAVGAGVDDLRPGDRVIPDHHYTGSGASQEGVITNQASRARQVFPAARLVRVPAAMPLETAAAFSLGAQTAYSMVRRLDVRPGERALVTAGGSNTSLFLISALRARGAVVHVVTSRAPALRARLEAHGAARVAAALFPLATEVGGFHHVLDPFYDLHLGAAVDVLRPGGRYITCGLLGGPARPLDAHDLFRSAIVKNLSFIGNCLGLRSDLEAALADHAAGLWSPVIDSVHGGGDARAFLDRTFNAPDRLGKVVYRHDA